MTSVPIVQSSVTLLEIPLHTSFAISKGALDVAKNVLIRISNAEGVTGMGEAAPFPVLTGDTQEDCFGACKALCDELKGVSARQGLHKLNEGLKNQFSKVPSACAGVEMALWDLYAKELGVPLAHLWGTASLSQTETDITLPIMSQNETILFWERFHNHGFGIIKVKVGARTVKEDVERIVTLKKVVPPSTRFTLDGNQGCSVESSLQMLEELKRFGVEPLFFEQPLPAKDWKGMQALTAKCPIPVCADETVVTAEDAIRVVNDKAAHMINLKFTKSGLAETLKIVTIAHSAGLPLMIGGMVETEIAMTASLHAVCGTGQIQWCDLDTPFFFAEHCCEESPYHGKNALLRLPTGSGIGLKLADKFGATAK